MSLVGSLQGRQPHCYTLPASPSHSPGSLTCMRYTAARQPHCYDRPASPSHSPGSLTCMRYTAARQPHCYDRPASPSHSPGSLTCMRYTAARLVVAWPWQAVHTRLCFPPFVGTQCGRRCLLSGAQNTGWPAEVGPECA